MSTYTFTLDDKLVGKISPKFSNEQALIHWLQRELELIVIRYAQTSTLQKKKYEKDVFMNKVKQLKNDKDGLFKLPYLLPKCKWTDEELLTLSI